MDNQQSLDMSVKYSINSAKSGVIARPHVAKDMVPGNNGWRNSVWSKQRNQILDNPQLFTNLDFVALASELTHPDKEFREMVNLAYLTIIRDLTPKGLCATNPLIPITGSKYDDFVSGTFNMLVPFDK